MSRLIPLLLLWSLTACGAKPQPKVSVLDKYFADGSLDMSLTDQQPQPSSLPPKAPMPKYSGRVTAVERGHSDIQLSSGDSAAAAKQVRRYMGAVRRCYEFYVAHSSDALRGQMVTQVTIEAGRVTQSKVVSDAINDVALVACIEKRTSRWRFTKTTTGELKQAFEMNWQPSVGP